MSDMTEIIISVVDRASAEFDQIANSADASFSNVEQAADSASTGMDGIETASSEANTAMNSIDSNSLDNVAASANSADTTLNNASSSATSLSIVLKDVSSSSSNASSGMSNAANSTSMFEAAGAGFVALGLGAAITESVNAAGTYTDSWSRMAEAVGSTSSTVQSEWGGAISTMSSTTGRGAGTIRGYITEMGVAGVNSQSVISTSFSGIAGAAYVTGSSIETISSSFERVVSTGTLGSRQLISMGLNSTDVMNATGMSVDQVSSALSTMDSTGRAAFMSQIMNAKYGQSANEEYKNSWQGVTDKLSLAEGYITRIFGGLILPIAIPALTVATGGLNTIASAVGSLSGPLQTVASIVTVGVVGWVLLYTTWMTASTVLGTMGISISGLTAGLFGNTGAINANIIAAGASRVADLASAGATAVRTAALEVENGVSMTALGAAMAHTSGMEINAAATNAGALSYVRAAISLTAQTVASGAQAAATGIVTGAQWLLNAALNANPIGIIVIAIVALIAILAYLYNSNETVRNAINGLWTGLQQLGGYIMGGLMAAWNGLITALSPITTALGLLWSAISKVWSAFAGNQASQANSAFSQISSAVMLAWNALSKLAGLILTALMPYLRTLWAFMSGAFMAVWRTLSGVIMAVITYVASFITILANLIAGNITASQALQQVWAAIQVLLFSVFNAIITGIGSFAASMVSYASQAASGMLNAFVSWLSSLPGTIWGYLMSALSYLSSFASSALSYAAQAGSNIVNAITNAITSLLGKMYQWGANLLQNFVNGIYANLGSLTSALSYISSLFPHSPPKEGPLATIKDENMQRFGSDLTGSMSTGLEEGAGNSFDFISGDSVNGSKGNTSSSSSNNQDTVKELKVTLVHDFLNVPQDISKAELLEALKGMTYDLGWIDTLIKTLSYGKVITKANLGA